MKKIFTMMGSISIVMGILNILAGLDIIGNYEVMQRAGGLIGGSMAVGLGIFIIWFRIKFSDRFTD